MKLLIVFGLFTLLLVAGCSLKQNEEVQQTQQQQEPQGNPQDVLQQNPPQDNNAVVKQDPKIVPPLVEYPFLCNDEDLVQKIERDLGPEYAIFKAPPAIGKTFGSANCYVTKNGVSIINYSLSGHVDSELALRVLEDEKNQYEEQLFNYDVEDAGLGLKGYLFDQPIKEGSLYRLIFVDSSNSKVVVFIKTSDVLDREIVLRLGQSIEEAI